MKRLLLAAALVALSAPAFAQFSTNGPVGQTPGGIQSNVFLQNTQSLGFADTSLSTVAGVGTSQATSAIIGTRTVIITACVATSTLGGVVLPSVERFAAIKIINRSGNSCLVYPSLGSALETALGTTGAANAAFTLTNNTDVTFHPYVSAVGSQAVWYQ